MGGNIKFQLKALKALQIYRFFTWGNFLLVFGKWIFCGKTTGFKISLLGALFDRTVILLSDIVVAACDSWKNDESLDQDFYLIKKLKLLTWILYTALSYKIWNVRNKEINITDKNNAANLGRDTPTINIQSE